MLGDEKKAMEVLKKYEGFDMIGEEDEGINAEEEEINLTPFPTSNRLCSIFPEFEFKKNRKFRLSFCLPAVHPPPIVFLT